MKVTYREVYCFLKLADRYFTWASGLESNKDSDLWKAFQVATQKTLCIRRELKSQMEEMDLKYCATDPVTKVILRDQNKELQFTKAGFKARKEAQDKLFNSEVEIEPILLHDELPGAFSDIEKQILSKFFTDGKS